MGSSMQALLFVFLLAAVFLFDTGESDKCHRKKGVCKLSIGGTCMGVSRSAECRFSYYRCCYPPMRGKRRKKRSSGRLRKVLTKNLPEV